MKISGLPDEAWIVCDALVGLEIPILDILRPCDMAIEKNELRALAVQGGMDIVLLHNRGNPAVVEKPDDGGRYSDESYFDLLPRAQSVDVFVETIMEQLVSIAPARIARADPDRISRIDVLIPLLVRYCTILFLSL